MEIALRRFDLDLYTVQTIPLLVNAVGVYDLSLIQSRHGTLDL
jgi:hypothetical protein